MNDQERAELYGDIRQLTTMVGLLLDTVNRILDESQRGQTLTPEKITLLRHHTTGWAGQLEKLKRTTASAALKPPNLLQ